MLLGETLRNEFNRNAAIRLLPLRYTQALITQIAQTVVCNRHHPIDQRLCRWLLLSLDRLPSNALRTTHELIAHMLGVRREGVTAAVSKLQWLGVIDHSRGHITVLDRPALERLSCECCSAAKQETDRLLPYPRVQPKAGARSGSTGVSRQNLPVWFGSVQSPAAQEPISVGLTCAPSWERWVGPAIESSGT